MYNALPDIPQALLASIDEVQQPRSRYQIEHFVLGQHDTIEMAYHQLCLELKDTITTLKFKELEIQKQKLQISRLRATRDEIDEIDAQIAEYGLTNAEAVYNGTVRELEILIDLWNQFPHKFTRAEIDAGQPMYWRLRLTRQAEMQAIGEGKVTHAQIDAMRQAGILEDWLKQREEMAALDARMREIAAGGEVDASVGGQSQ